MSIEERVVKKQLGCFIEQLRRRSTTDWKGSIPQEVTNLVRLFPFRDWPLWKRSKEVRHLVNQVVAEETKLFRVDFYGRLSAAVLLQSIVISMAFIFKG